MKKPRAVVSDHAVIRYMERVMGLDMDVVRHEIARKVDKAMDHPGCSAIIVDGMEYCLKGQTVTTVLYRGGRE